MDSSRPRILHITSISDALAVDKKILSDHLRLSVFFSFLMVCGEFVSPKRSSLLLYFFGLIKAIPEAHGLSPKRRTGQ
jgi:hypothetical protein